MRCSLSSVALCRDLVSYTRFCFKIKPTAWRKFLGRHRLAVDDCVIKLEQKKIDIDAIINGTAPSRSNSGGFYVVRIGIKTEESPNRIEDQRGRDGQLITAPPRMNLLRITQQSFQIIVDQYLWQYTINNDDGDEDKDIGTASSSTAGLHVRITTSSISRQGCQYSAGQQEAQIEQSFIVD